MSVYIYFTVFTVLLFQLLIVTMFLFVFAGSGVLGFSFSATVVCWVTVSFACLTVSGGVNLKCL